MARLRRRTMWQAAPDLWVVEWVKANGRLVWTYHATEAEALAAKMEGER